LKLQLTTGALLLATQGCGVWLGVAIMLLLTVGHFVIAMETVLPCLAPCA